MKNADTTFLLALLRSSGTLVADPQTTPALDWAAALTSSDWTTLLAQAQHHDLAGLVFVLCQRAKLLPQMPPAVVNDLQSAYARTVASNLKLYHQLAQVLAAMQEAGIPTLLLKGAHLAQTVYGDIGLRTMSDLDLLVAEADLPRAHQRLLALGYRPPTAISSTFHHLPELSKPGAFTIDLHWTILPTRQNQALPSHELWQRARPLHELGQSAFGLAPEDLLLHLILHTAVQHTFVFGLRSLYDIVAVIHHFAETLDWSQVATRAGEWQIARATSLTLTLCRDLLGAAIPASCFTQLQACQPAASIVAQAQMVLFTGATTPMLLPHSLLQIGSRAQGPAQLRQLLQSIFLPPAIMVRLYGVTPGSLALYRAYGNRLCYLWRQHRQTVWRLLRREPAITVAASYQKNLLEWFQIG